MPLNGFCIGFNIRDQPEFQLLVYKQTVNEMFTPTLQARAAVSRRTGRNVKASRKADLEYRGYGTVYSGTAKRPFPAQILIMGRHAKERASAAAHQFLFATGIENSYPVITGKNGESIRRDELESTGFYEHWREDFDLLREVGVEYLRYGPQYYRVNTGAGRYDWEFTDRTFARLREIGVIPIADLCHFGLPEWIGDFQNPDWPELFAAYARAFAQRYPWARLMTPVNEIFVNSTFSAQNGWWNERLQSDRAFVTALKHMCKATVRAEEEILKVQPEAIFIQSEATACYHERSRRAAERARTENEKRFLSFDLCYGHRVRSDTYEYLMDNGLSRSEYHWFLEHGPEMRPHCIWGAITTAPTSIGSQPRGRSKAQARYSATRFSPGNITIATTCPLC